VPERGGEIYLIRSISLARLQHLELLRKGEAVDIPVYDFATHLRKEGEVVHIEPRPIILVEGILILHEPILRDQVPRAPACARLCPASGARAHCAPCGARMHLRRSRELTGARRR